MCGSAMQSKKKMTVFSINDARSLGYSYGKIGNFFLLPSIYKIKFCLDCRSKIYNIRQTSRI